MRYQDSYRQYRMMMAAVAPTEYVYAVGSDVRECWRFGKFVGHAAK
jgi:hypothetical protein